jgi:hypothetical protein
MPAIDVMARTGDTHAIGNALSHRKHRIMRALILESRVGHVATALTRMEGRQVSGKNIAVGF